MKECFRCGKRKPLDQFYRQAQMADGHLNKCKTCTVEDVKKNREANIERYRQYDRERGKLPHRKAAVKRYQQTEKGKEAHGRAAREWARKNAHKRQAHNAINNALRDGKLSKPDGCSVCGRAENLHAHHDDYTKPMEVRWLCPPCHSQAHD